MSEWIKAEEYCVSVFDGTHDTPKVTETGYKLVTSKNILSNTLDLNSAYFISEEDFVNINKRSKVKQYDILFSMIGTVGSLYFETSDTIDYAIKNIGVFSCGDKEKTEWLYYYLQSSYARQYIKRYLNGAVQKFLPLKGLREFPVPQFNKELHNRIKILLNIDQKIQINNQINQELEAMAKTLYDYWFVQFDFPDQNGNPYKSSGGKMVYNPELKREIPEGWGVTTFSSWISDNKTGDWGKETSQGNYTLEVDCIRGADINGLSGNGKIDMPTRFILEKNKNKLLTDFDIVIEISGGSPTQSTGRIVGICENVLNRFELPLICSNFCKAVSLNEQETFYNFVYEWKNLYDNGVLFSWEGKTSGIKNLLFDSFVTNYHIAQPPIDLMKQFFDYASSVDKKTQLLLKQNQELTKLRDWLLPMLMNGQVKVEDKT